MITTALIGAALFAYLHHRCDKLAAPLRPVRNEWAEVLATVCMGACVACVLAASAVAIGRTAVH